MLAKKREDRPSLPALRKRIQELLARLPARTVQSMMFAITDPEQHALHEKKTLLTADANARQVETQYLAIEKIEIERAQVGTDVNAAVDRMLNLLPVLPAGELSTLRAQWVENRLRDQQVEQELAKVRQRREAEEQAVMRRKSEMHELIDKLRSDIRKRPPQDHAEREEDEHTLAQLEQSYFEVQLRPQFSERIVRLLAKQQRIRHQYFLCLYKLGVALIAHLRALGKQRPRSLKAAEVEGMDWSLEHLGRCNQNVGVLVDELPSAALAGGTGRKAAAGR